MVKIEAVRASNARVKAFPRGLVAIFVGGTSGIAESTAKQFCRYAVEPRIFLVGRNADAATRITSELKGISPAGTYSFIQKDVSLLKNVDEACALIKSQVSKINLLFLSSGTMSLKGRVETSEGIDKKLATNYYSRMRFTQQLLPLLRAGSPELSRVISVLAPGTESASFNRKDLGLKDNFSLSNAANHAVVMTDFCFEEYAKENPTVSFIHSRPGVVKSGFTKEQSAVVRMAAIVAAGLLTPWVIPLGESGERHLYLATNGRYPGKDGSKTIPATAKEGGVMKGSDGKIGSGAYLVGESGEFSAKEVVLSTLRDKSVRGLIWEHTLAEFERATGKKDL